MKEGVGKRGLSPVIATVLLILMVIVLAALIFLWARGFIGEQIEKFGDPIVDSCEQVDLRIATESIQSGAIEIANNGDIDVANIEFRMSKDGNTISRWFDTPIDAQRSAIKYVSLSMSETDKVIPDKVVAYPMLLGKVSGKSTNNFYTCINSGVTL